MPQFLRCVPQAADEFLTWLDSMPLARTGLDAILTSRKRTEQRRLAAIGAGGMVRRAQSLQDVGDAATDALMEQASLYTGGCAAQGEGIIVAGMPFCHALTHHHSPCAHTHSCNPATSVPFLLAFDDLGRRGV